MARERMITRTMKTTKVNVLCLELDTVEPCNKDIVIPTTFKDKKKLFNKVKEMIDTDQLKAVNITSAEEVETLYGMSEEDFIAHAKELDPSTRKALETEN